jgi:hypothetical protein
MLAVLVEMEPVHQLKEVVEEVVLDLQVIQEALIVERVEMVFKHQLHSEIQLHHMELLDLVVLITLLVVEEVEILEILVVQEVPVAAEEVQIHLQLLLVQTKMRYKTPVVVVVEEEDRM